MRIARAQIQGLVLAGGAGTRAGGLDKGLIELDGEPAVVRCARALEAQVGSAIVSANRNLEAYVALGFDPLADALEGFQGPLAGIARGLELATKPWLLTVPVDAWHFPVDLAQRLATALEAGDELAVAHDGNDRQPLFALYTRALAAAAADALAHGERAVHRFQDTRALREVVFAEGAEAFPNRNRP